MEDRMSGCKTLMKQFKIMEVESQVFSGSIYVLAQDPKGCWSVSLVPTQFHRNHGTLFPGRCFMKGVC